MQRHAPQPPVYQPSTTTTTEAPTDSQATENHETPQNSTKGQAPSFVLSGDFLPPMFRSQSLQLARDIVNYVCRHENAIHPPNHTAVIMRGLVDDTLKNRLDMMCHMVMKLDVKTRDQLQLVDSIATSMFDDEMVNWGRIVTLCAFCGYLARYCEERMIPHCVDDLSTILGNIIINRLGLWIVANGGWSGFEKQFPAVCMWDSSGMWKAVAIAAFLVCAILAFYSAIKSI